MGLNPGHLLKSFLLCPLHCGYFAYLKALFVVVRFQSDPGRLYLLLKDKSLASRDRGNKLREVDGFRFPLLGNCQGYYNTGWFNPEMRSRAVF